MTPAVLVRATEPFPSPVRTLDAPHLATYDARMCASAKAMKFETVEP